MTITNSEVAGMSVTTGDATKCAQCHHSFRDGEYVEYLPRTGVNIHDPNHGGCDQVNHEPAGLPKDHVHLDGTTDEPVLPYPDTDGHTQGHSGSDTSKARAHRDVKTGKAQDRQASVLVRLLAARWTGMTWFELGEAMGLHHGQVSSALSVLHRDGKIARIRERRGQSEIYVLPEFVGEREVSPRRTRTKVSAESSTVELMDWIKSRQRTLVINKQELTKHGDIAGAHRTAGAIAVLEQVLSHMGDRQ